MINNMFMVIQHRVNLESITMDIYKEGGALSEKSAIGLETGFSFA